MRHFPLASILLYVLSLLLGQLPAYCQQQDSQPILLRAEIPTLAPVTLNNVRQPSSDCASAMPPPAVPYRVAQARAPAIPAQIKAQTLGDLPAMATLGTLRTSLANSDLPSAGSANLRPSMVAQTEPEASTAPVPAALCPTALPPNHHLPHLRLAHPPPHLLPLPPRTAARLRLLRLNQRVERPRIFWICSLP